MSSTLCSECMEDEHCNGKYEQCTCNCMTTTDTTSELRDTLADARFNDEPGVDGLLGANMESKYFEALLEKLAAQKQRWEAETLKMARDDMKGISFEHGDKVNGNHDFMRGISAARRLLLDRIEQLTKSNKEKK